ncbi:MAG: sugar ABC transporter permease [Sphaerochaeta sp.]|nr:sugar ABC transporter permease [Sphaerochaeta sp.]
MKQRTPLQRRIESGKDFATVLPALLFLGLFIYYPVVQVVRISFTNWNLINDNYKYVGLKNWIWLFQGSGTKYLLNSLKVTALFTLGELTVTIVGGMIFALIMNRITASFSVMRALVFLPKYVAMSSAAVVFIWILNTQNGILNFFIEQFGGERVNWLGDRNRALLSILMLTGWRTVGYGMMIYIASMRGISKNYYEAASIDGASKWIQFSRITLPLLSPTTLFLFVTTFISAMKVFQSVDVLTSGGPYRSTEVIVFMIYKYAMEDFRMDRASTIAVVFFLVLLGITAATMRISNKRVNYDA